MMSSSYLGDNGLFEYGPVVGELPTRHDRVRERVTCATLVGGRVGDERRHAAAAVVCAVERRPGR